MPRERREEAVERHRTGFPAKRYQGASSNAEGRGLAIDRTDDRELAPFRGGNRRKLIVHVVISTRPGMRDGRDQRIYDRKSIFGGLRREWIRNGLTAKVDAIFGAVVRHDERIVRVDHEALHASCDARQCVGSERPVCSGGFCIGSVHEDRIALDREVDAVRSRTIWLQLSGKNLVGRSRSVCWGRKTDGKAVAAGDDEEALAFRGNAEVGCVQDFILDLVVGVYQTLTPLLEG